MNGIYSRCGFVLIICIFLLTAGCAVSGQGRMSDADIEQSNSESTIKFNEDENAALNAVAKDRLFKFLGKRFNKRYAEKHRKLLENHKYKIENPNIDLALSIRQKTIYEFFTLVITNVHYTSDSLDFNYDSIIRDGLLAVIPRNPYSGEDMKTSCEYSPGDMLLARDKRGFVFLYHAGEKESQYDPSRSNFNRIMYKPKLTGIEECTDGRTQIRYFRFQKGKSQPVLIKDIDQPKAEFISTFFTLMWLNDQVRDMMKAYSKINDDVPDNIDGYLNYFGRKNPAAWINPYTQKEMKKVDFPETSFIFPSGEIEYFKESVSRTVIEVDDKNKYAGNYSFDVFEGSNGPIAVFTLYSLDQNGEIRASYSKAISKSHLRSLYPRK